MRWETKTKMAAFEEQLKNALIELRKGKERKFDQTVDLVINLQKFDVKKTNVNIVANLPHKIKEKKIAGFFEVKSPLVDTITPAEFKNYSDKNKLKKIVKKYDFFIAEGKLMPKVATTFGKVLGPAGKMPSPQLGLLMNVNDKAVQDLKDNISNSMKIKVKESSVKLAIGKQSMKDEDIIENINSIYNTILKNLPRDKENIKNIEVKFTMTKPQKINIR